jgi:hypothetical protein
LAKVEVSFRGTPSKKKLNTRLFLVDEHETIPSIKNNMIKNLIFKVLFNSCHYLDGPTKP